MEMYAREEGLRVSGDIKEKGLSGRECTTELHIIVKHRLTKRGSKMKRFL